MPVYATSTTCTANATTAIWTDWIDSTQTTGVTTTTAPLAWRVWVTSTTSTAAWQCWNESTWEEIGERRVLTEEQHAEGLRQANAAAAQRKLDEEKRQKAMRRAEELLYEHLTDEQRAQIKRHKFFVVQGGKSGSKYKINADGNLAGNVHELNGDGSIKRRLCAHVNHGAQVPHSDHYLAQKLMLEHSEEEFLRVANVH